MLGLSLLSAQAIDNPIHQAQGMCQFPYKKVVVSSFTEARTAHIHKVPES